MKTKFTFKNGAVRSINHKAAEILQKAGKGTYQTRDMVADRFDPTPYEPSIPVNLAELEAAAELADDLAQQLRRHGGLGPGFDHPADHALFVDRRRDRRQFRPPPRHAHRAGLHAGRFPDVGSLHLL